MALIDDIRPPGPPEDVVKSAKPSRYDTMRPHPLLQRPVHKPPAPVAPVPAPVAPALTPKPTAVSTPVHPAPLKPVQPQAPVQKPVFDIRPPQRHAPVQPHTQLRSASPPAQPVATHPPMARPAQRPEPVERPQPAPIPTSKLARPTVSTPKPKRRSKLLNALQYPLIAAAALGMAYSSTVGQAIIGAYFLLAIIFRISSRFSFAVALVLLLCIPFFQILHMDGVSENAAIYAYEMLVVGTVQAIIELWRDNRRAKHKRIA